MDNSILRNNFIFWSRLGLHPDPYEFYEDGATVLYDEDLSDLRYHKNFYEKGVKLHSFIIPTGWVKDGVYDDFRSVDKVMDAACTIGPDIMIIPRIRFDVPIDWCKNHPEDVFVYYDGPRDKEGVIELVGTLDQDYLGYEAPEGEYMGDPKYARPNVNGKISRQSFTSDIWLRDAKTALETLVLHLEEKYGEKIIGYHITYGISGETALWGRLNQRYGDYGIVNREKFRTYVKEKYNLDAELPSPKDRYYQNDTVKGFMRADNPFARYADELMDEVNANAIEYLCKVCKGVAPNKFTGVFYGYFLGICDSGYTGHTNIQKLIDSPYVDFFSAPKLYARCTPGDAGGEFSTTQSINLDKVWLDECDVRTHLADADTPPQWASRNMTETKNALTRELAKNMSHDSGFWFMDLGGTWYDSSEMMDLVSELSDINNIVRKKEHASKSDVLVLIDEKSTSMTGVSLQCLRNYLVDTLITIKRTGALVDTFRMTELERLDLSQYKMIVFPYNFRLNEKELSYIKERTDAAFFFQYAAGCCANDEFSLENVNQITGFTIEEFENNACDYPNIRVTEKDSVVHETDCGNLAVKEVDGRLHILSTVPLISQSELQKMVKKAGCHIICDSDYVLYGDNRFLAVIASDKAFDGEIDFGEEREWSLYGTDKSGTGSKVKVRLAPYETAVFLF